MKAGSRVSAARLPHLKLSPDRKALIVVAAALASVLLASCGQPVNDEAQAPAQSEQRETTVPPTASPDPTADPGTGAAGERAGQPTHLPQICSELLPEPGVKAADPRIEVFDTPATPVIERMQREVGPLTMETLLGGEQQLYCSYGIRQTDGGGSIGVAVISADKKAELLEALRSSVYDEIDPAAAEAAFYRGASAEHRLTAEILVDRDVLIVVPRTIDGNYAWDALAVIQAGRTP